VQLPALPLFLSLLEAIHANDLSSITLSPLFVPQTSLHALSPSFQANRPFITASFSLSLKAQFGKDIFLAFCSFLFLILRSFLSLLFSPSGAQLSFKPFLLPFFSLWPPRFCEDWLSHSHSAE
jgi:hypothetical protein